VGAPATVCQCRLDLRQLGLEVLGKKLVKVANFAQPQEAHRLLGLLLRGKNVLGRAD